jgi:hypothetical protein
VDRTGIAILGAIVFHESGVVGIHAACGVAITSASFAFAFAWLAAGPL